MINTTKLRAKIVENNLTQGKVADRLGIAPKTFYLKMKSGVFRSDEIEKMIDLLHIQKPEDIFFASKVS